MPQSPFDQLTSSVAEYGRRFGHTVPRSALRDLDSKELQQVLDEALRSGRPVEGWSDETFDMVRDRPPQVDQPAKAPTIGAPTSTTKRTGIVFRTVGTAYSRKDSGTLSFPYFLTPDGKPPKKDPESKK